MDINVETKKLNDLRKQFESAKSSYFSDLERDVNRRDGSSRQDALHERFMEESRDRYLAAKSAFEAQEKLVASLRGN
ncbi:TPA: hypothetical protein NJ546_004451 [Vibrio parahaemolyticus]|uniref:Uncharacterized protein n=1 Tax=Vibrio parahaemolyticus TaxID=670 RepID=A0AA47JDW1_VIBPH|nr:hypothetical protein [Vibrio parahaemolyticus]EGR1345765.1 hypothetical protein [Vibrio parahaemolyticus]EGR2744548.1 hypothetical protein [Vibrio parahaemolyticus]EGR2875463.1 hypothetical protein [Vibrio parahaemolyticus]EHJ9995231.1 hypothetical protein [Vibrio parahaemolyticus]EIC2576110.1 hypothetical protein [Vibrio parahaemolyticus]